MKKLTLKELRTALRVLQSLPIEVPHTLLVELSQRIRNEEVRRHERKIGRMSDEELIVYEQRKRTHLSVTLDDGRLICHPTNDLTFHAVLREIGIPLLQMVHIQVRHHLLLLFDDTLQRRRLTGYQLVSPGLFVYGKTTAREKLIALQQLDEALHLNMDIELR